MIWNNPKLTDTFQQGRIAVMPTDTIYGLVCSALNREAVEKIYQLRRRAPEKPCIILIGDIAELEKFSIKLSREEKNKLKKYWSALSPASPNRGESLDGPGPVSIILDCLDDKFSYLHCGTKGLAFRIPQEPDLRNLLIRTGPLIAPSANTEGMPPAKNIAEARTYFGDAVDLYLDGGEIISQPSKVVEFCRDGSVKTIRA